MIRFSKYIAFYFLFQVFFGGWYVFVGQVRSQTVHRFYRRRIGRDEDRRYYSPIVTRGKCQKGNMNIASIQKSFEKTYVLRVKPEESEKVNVFLIQSKNGQYRRTLRREIVVRSLEKNY